MKLLVALLKWLGLAATGLLVSPRDAARRRAESIVILLLLAAAGAATAFVVLYALDASTQLLGLALGGALALIAAALIVVARRVLPTEEHEDSYSEPHPAEQEQVAQELREGGRAFTRKKLIGGAAVAAGGALGAAALAPALSLGPALDTESLYDSPWRRGRRLVDSGGRPYSADDIEPGAFYTAYPAGAHRDEIAAPVVVVRLAPALLDLPPERRDWAPEGIVAYSKICTHAGCAVALYRSPKFDPTQPDAALMCPCHYSTFDPATGGTVLFGPAGRPLPQLPLQIGRGRSLRAAGNFSGPVGPSWSGVRSRGPR